MSNISMQELPKERWTNEPQPQAPNQSYIEQILEDTKYTFDKDQDLKMEDGEVVELTFATDDPDTGPAMQKRVVWDNVTNKPVVGVDGNKVYDEIPRFRFIVYNHKLKRQQNWWVSKTTAHEAAECMSNTEMGFNIDTLMVKRTGKKQDTRYSFKPVGFKTAG